MNRRRLVAIAIFALTAALLGVGLRLDPRELPSPLIGSPAPGFALPVLHEPDKIFTHREMLGSVWVLNVWASWCISCREEHAAITALAKSGAARVVGLNFKDEPEQARAWLARFGNPYVLSVQDREGRLGPDYGVRVVPETYVIDKGGVVRYKRVGVLTDEIVRQRILPLIEALKNG